jgi:hypothetical protein
MLNDFLLAPGRYLCRKFSGSKRRKSRFVPKQAVRGPVGLISFITWALVAALAFFGVVTFASPPYPGYKEAKAEPETVNQAGQTPAPSAQAQSSTVPNAQAQNAQTAQSQLGAAPAQAATQTASSQVTGQVNNADQALPSLGTDQSSATETVAAVSEAWLVIVESIPKNKRVEAEQSLARHKKRGLSLEIVDTDAYPRLKGGMWTLASGPYETEKEAQAAAAIIKPKVRDLMIRRGL